MLDRVQKSTRSVQEHSSEQNHTTRPKNACIIYVFGEPDGKIVKLGKTRQPAGMRKKQHEKRGPNTTLMQFLMGVWGIDSDERYLIDYWKRNLRGGSEWFEANESFRSWLRFCRDLPYVARKDADLENLPYFADSRQWLPGFGHLKTMVQRSFNFDQNDPWADLETSEVGDGDYYTHAEMTKAARIAMGHIDLDPASCREANSLVMAKRFFGSKEDGLSKEWTGNVWLNPPFGQWPLWAPKALEEYRSGRVSQMCVFVTANAATSIAFHPLIANASAIFLPSGRYGCWGPKSSAPTEGNFILYFGPNTEGFKFAYQSFGTCFVGFLSPGMCRLRL